MQLLDPTPSQAQEWIWVGLIVLRVTSEASAAATAERHLNSAFYLIGQNLDLLTACLFRVITGPRDQIVYESDASELAPAGLAQGRQESYASSVMRWRDDWNGTETAVCISTALWNQIRSAHRTSETILSLRVTAPTRCDRYDRWFQIFFMFIPIWGRFPF